MDVQQDIAALEARIQAAGLTVAEFCKRIPLDYANWWRMKKGKQGCRLETWRNIEAAAAQLPPPEAAA